MKVLSKTQQFKHEVPMSHEYNSVVEAIDTLVWEGQYQEAERVGLDLLRRGPNDLNLLMMLATICREQKDYRNQNKYLEHAKANASTDHDYARAISNFAAKNYDPKRDNAESIRQIRWALKVFRKGEYWENFAGSLALLAHIESDRGNLGRASKLLAMATTLRRGRKPSNLRESGTVKSTRENWPKAWRATVPPIVEQTIISEPIEKPEDARRVPRGYMPFDLGVSVTIKSTRDDWPANWRAAASCIFQQAKISERMEKLEDARRRLLVAHRICRRQGLLDQECNYALAIGEFEHRQGELQSARKWTCEGIDLAQRGRLQHRFGTAFGNLETICSDLGITTLMVLQERSAVFLKYGQTDRCRNVEAVIAMLRGLSGP